MSTPRSSDPAGPAPRKPFSFQISSSSSYRPRISAGSGGASSSSGSSHAASDRSRSGSPFQHGTGGFVIQKPRGTGGKPPLSLLRNAFERDDGATSSTKRQRRDDPNAGEADRVVKITGISGTTVHGDFVDESKQEQARVIRVPGNRDWRDVVRERSASHTPQNGSGTSTPRPMVGGLHTAERSKLDYLQPVSSGDAVKEDASLDILARQALLDDAVRTDTTESPASALSSLVIPLPDQYAASDGAEQQLPQSMAEREREAYLRDISCLPDSATLDDYDDTPVEVFGAALLRGMGWRDGQAVGRRRGETKVAVVGVAVVRPRLLGLGAKEMPPELKKKGAGGPAGGPTGGRRLVEKPGEGKYAAAKR